ncbi:polysaccharide biosynthesis/export family protein [Sinorhizobium meliloti]|uniref:polysaccharide biosynthesis/export family protein n=1 Tax=Rhizobium meliloti TaxID=382 RepID=UPI0001E4C4A5|nr:polysaccharide biosynthesis/export family protein [Sinorhizobium meliloti]AEG57998.1 polysaccharide export protein [Sinorhizobium meliloti AK83]MDE4586584.1 polysaccharide biosynthesis/export family protein [Sinorhizobium meliloti]RVH00922.1 polysaccharide export protein [Sinorhizobium meliloti]SEJ54951.1 protein involved in polysaccharide export, contains SLBB domain of the beta-grasp fold [Sinorhizobium meliloti]
MDHATKSEATRGSSALPYSDGRSTAAPFHRVRHGLFTAAFSIIPFSFIVLFAASAGGQSAAVNGLAPQDAVEIHLPGWHTLFGDAAKAALPNGTFTIGSAGALELPGIGRVPAAGLHASELAKLIADRLQARSGSHDSPVTIVEPRRPALEGQRVSPPAKQPAMVEREAMQALGGERSSVEALLRDLAAARKEAEAAREEERAAHQAARDASILHRRHLAAERQRAAKLTQELTAARVDLETMKTQLKQETNAAHDWKAAVAMIKAAREAAARERSERAALEEELRAARREIEAARNGAQMVASEREEPLRHDMVPATGALDTMGVAAGGAGAQARKAADTMAERESALEQQRQRAEGLARDLTVLRRDMDSLQAKVAGAIRSKAAALRARRAGEAALVDAKRALVEERQKIGVYARDLALALQSAAALESRAKLAAAEQAAAAQARKIAEAAAKRAGEALALELEAGKSLARELDTARRERDAAKEELTQVLAQHTSLKGERARANGRELSAARQQHDGKKARTERRVEDVDEPKTRAGNHASERAKTARATGTRSVREPGARKGRTLETRKPLKIALPNALLPKRWLAPGLW